MRRGYFRNLAVKLGSKLSAWGSGSVPTEQPLRKCAVSSSSRTQSTYEHIFKQRLLLTDKTKPYADNVMPMLKGLTIDESEKVLVYVLKQLRHNTIV